MVGAGLDFESTGFGDVVFAGVVDVLAGVLAVLVGVVVPVFAGVLTVLAGAVAGLNSLKPPARVNTHIALYCGCAPHEIPAT